MTDARYFYYVSYAHERGFGANEIGTTLPVVSMADVTVMADAAARAAGCPVVVLNFQLLRGPDAPANNGST